MATIVTRSGKGSALTHNEMDANFNNLNGDKVETSLITQSSTDTTAGRLLKVGDTGTDQFPLLAPLANPELTGNPTAPTPPPGDSSTRLSTTEFVSNNKQTCNSWVNFDGTGVPTIRDSYNVASITDNGTGNYIVLFNTAMSNANYCINVSFGRNDLAGGEVRNTNGTNMPTISGFSIGCNNSPGTSTTDHKFITAVIFGS